MQKERFDILESTCVPLPLENVDTDQIIPARFLSATSREGFGENLFRDWRYDNAGNKREGFVLNDAQYRGSVLVAGRNFGCGSSREHAAICPMYLGVRLVMAKSFERIHSDNLINFGIIPLVFKKTEDYDRIKNGDSLVIRNLWTLIMEAETIPVTIVGSEYALTLALSQRQRAMLLEGGLLNDTKKKFGA